MQLTHYWALERRKLIWGKKEKKKKKERYLIDWNRILSAGLFNLGLRDFLPLIRYCCLFHFCSDWSWWFYFISPNIHIELIFFHRLTGTHRSLLQKIIEVNRHCEYYALGFSSYLIALVFRYTRTISWVFYSQAGLPAYLQRVNLQLYWQVFSHENSNVQMFIFKLYAHPTREPKGFYNLSDQM